MATTRPDRKALEARHPGAADLEPDDIREGIALLTRVVLSISPLVGTPNARARMQTLLERLHRHERRRYVRLEGRILAAPKREPIDAILSEFPPAHPFDMAVWQAKVDQMRALLVAGLPELQPVHAEYVDRIDEAQRRLQRP